MQALSTKAICRRLSQKVILVALIQKEQFNREIIFTTLSQTEYLMET